MNILNSDRISGHVRDYGLSVVSTPILETQRHVDVLSMSISPWNPVYHLQYAWDFWEASKHQVSASQSIRSLHPCSWIERMFPNGTRPWTASRSRVETRCGFKHLLWFVVPKRTYRKTRSISGVGRRTLQHRKRWTALRVRNRNWRVKDWISSLSRVTSMRRILARWSSSARSMIKWLRQFTPISVLFYLGSTAGKYTKYHLYLIGWQLHRYRN